jgi:hypothetical protein
MTKDVEERVGFRFFPGMNAAPKYLHLESQRSGMSYFFYGLIGLAVLIAVACTIVMCMEKSDAVGKKVDVEEDVTPRRSLREQYEDASRDRRRRKTLESAIGGEAAVRARFRAV